MSDKKYIKSKVDYFNILTGDLCEVVEVSEIFVKVVKVGLDQIHYLYNFEFDVVEPSKEEVWEAYLTPIVQVLASCNSISSGRSYNDILIMIDGGEMPPVEDFENRGDLAPSTLPNEVFKFIGDCDDDEMIDSILCGDMHDFICKKFIHTFYVMRYAQLSSVVKHWGSLKDLVMAARK